METVIGYHGTSRERAESILREGFQLSANPYDWLGAGAYFFERSHVRAAEWAERAYGEGGCVLRAKISLEAALDLTDTADSRVLQPYFEAFVSEFGEEHVVGLRQTSGAHRFDCAVIDYACADLEGSGREVHVVRSAFQEGEPLWTGAFDNAPTTAFLTHSHIQLAVKSPDAITTIELMSDRRSRPADE